jgi:GntR family transcriptional regulator
MPTLNQFTFDPANFTPKFIQVAQILREAIDQGRYKPGEKLPSEKELVQEFGVSRITAIAALDELVKAHLAFRERGRGTFVAKPFVSNFSFFTSYTEDMHERGLNPSSRLISLQIQPPDPQTAEKLKVPAEGTYYCLVRVRLANNEPVALQHAYLPMELYPDLAAQDFEQQYLYEVIRRTYGFKPTWAEAIVESAAASAEEASLLKVKTGAPVLMLWNLTLDDRYLPLEYVRSVYRADRFSFSTGRNPLRS